MTALTARLTARRDYAVRAMAGAAALALQVLFLLLLMQRGVFVPRAGERETYLTLTPVARPVPKRVEDAPAPARLVPKRDAAMPDYSAPPPLIWAPQPDVVSPRGGAMNMQALVPRCSPDAMMAMSAAERAACALSPEKSQAMRWNDPLAKPPEIKNRDVWERAYAQKNAPTLLPGGRFFPFVALRMMIEGKNPLYGTENWKYSPDKRATGIDHDSGVDTFFNPCHVKMGECSDIVLHGKDHIKSGR